MRKAGSKSQTMRILIRLCHTGPVWAHQFNINFFETASTARASFLLEHMPELTSPRRFFEDLNIQLKAGGVRSGRNREGVPVLVKLSHANEGRTDQA